MKQGRTGKIGTIKTGNDRTFRGVPVEATKTSKETDREREIQKLIVLIAELDPAPK